MIYWLMPPASTCYVYLRTFTPKYTTQQNDLKSRPKTTLNHPHGQTGGLLVGDAEKIAGVQAVLHRLAHTPGIAHPAVIKKEISFRSKDWH